MVACIWGNLGGTTHPEKLICLMPLERCRGPLRKTPLQKEELAVLCAEGLGSVGEAPGSCTAL